MRFPRSRRTRITMYQLLCICSIVRISLVSTSTACDWFLSKSRVSAKPFIREIFSLKPLFSLRLARMQRVVASSIKKSTSASIRSFATSSRHLYANSATMTAPIVHRATHIGSWLRPAEVKQARTKFFAGESSPEELRKVEDKNIAEVVKEQQKIGLKSVSDGEYRRE